MPTGARHDQSRGGRFCSAFCFLSYRVLSVLSPCTNSSTLVQNMQAAFLCVVAGRVALARLTQIVRLWSKYQRSVLTIHALPACIRSCCEQFPAPIRVHLLIEHDRDRLALLFFSLLLCCAEEILEPSFPLMLSLCRKVQAASPSAL